MFILNVDPLKNIPLQDRWVESAWSALVYVAHLGLSWLMWTSWSFLACRSVLSCSPRHDRAWTALCNSRLTADSFTWANIDHYGNIGESDINKGPPLIFDIYTREREMLSLAKNFSCFYVCMLSLWSVTFDCTCMFCHVSWTNKTPDVCSHGTIQ